MARIAGEKEDWEEKVGMFPGMSLAVGRGGQGPDMPVPDLSRSKRSEAT
jgi:hypothetical protein